MTYASYADVEQHLGNRESRKVANNTYLVRRSEDAIAVRLHATDIVTFTPDGITLQTGGWYTVTTKERLNRYVPFGYLYSDRGVWYVGIRHNAEHAATLRYFDGMRLAYGTGDLLNPEDMPPDADADRKAVERDISRYVKLVRDALPLADPSGADCWYCVMRTDDGTPLGDAVGDTEHLQSHLAEGYVVPSLVLNAMRERNYGNLAVVWAMFVRSTDPNRDAVGRDVRRYLRKRLVRGN